MSAPSWMEQDDYPIPEVRDAIRAAKEKSTKNIRQLSEPSPQPAPSQPPPSSPPPTTTATASQDGVNLTEGTVFLIWKDVRSDDVEMEEGKFPTKSTFSISMFKDFENPEQMKQHVGEMQKLADEYNKQKRGGIYAIVVGRLVKGTQTKVVETVEVLF